MAEPPHVLKDLLGESPLIVLDLDETLAEAGLTGSFVPALARIFLGHGFYRTQPEAESAIIADFRKSGCSVRSIGARHGYTDAAWIADVYRRICQAHLPVALGTLTPDPRLHRLLDIGQSLGCTFAVLTQSHTEGYAKPILRHLGLSPWIPPERVFGLTENAVHKRVYLKSVNGPYRHLLQRLPGPYSSRWMVEDSPLNLVPAKANGFFTVLVGGRQPTPWQARRIDHRHQTLSGFLQHLFGAHPATLAA